MLTALQDRRTQAEVEFKRHLGEDRAANIVESLWPGLSTLRRLLLTRLHNDVETHFGMDPVLPPPTTSETNREIHHAAGEIEIYSLVVVMDEVVHSRFVGNETDWFRDWLIRLRWGEEIPAVVEQRMRLYEPQDNSRRRRAFASSLERAFPEAMRAPLIIYRLYPRAVRLATAIAFGDRMRANEIRNEQISYLPAIEDCHACHGRPLDNGEVCQECGNPLWKIRWLCAID